MNINPLLNYGDDPNYGGMGKRGLNLRGRRGHMDYLPYGVVPKPPSYPPPSKISPIAAAEIKSIDPSIKKKKKVKVIFPEKEVDVITSDPVNPVKKKGKTIIYKRGEY